jgi:hypothetical protein
MNEDDIPGKRSKREEMRNAHKLWSGTLKKRDHLGPDGRMIVKLI